MLGSKRIADLAEQYRLDSGEIPPETVTSLPVPVAGDDDVRVVFLVSRVEGAPPAPPVLLAPSWHLVVDAMSGRVEVAPVTPAESPRALGVWAYAPAMAYAELDLWRDRLFKSLDFLMPFVPLIASGKPPALQHEANGYRQLWIRLAQQPLQRHYSDLHPLWFRFLGIGL